MVFRGARRPVIWVPIALLLLTAVFFLLTDILQIARAEQADPYSKFYELYGRTVRLASRGVDVSEVIEHLSKALKLLEAGRYGDALEEMERAEAILSEIEPAADRVVLEKNLVRYGTVAALASLPAAIYVLLPRAYIYAWYRARRRWVVAHERSR